MSSQSNNNRSDSNRPVITQKNKNTVNPSLQVHLLQQKSYNNYDRPAIQEPSPTNASNFRQKSTKSAKGEISLIITAAQVP